MPFLDKTFCASPNCQNECGRKMTDEEKKKYNNMMDDLRQRRFSVMTIDVQAHLKRVRVLGGAASLAGCLLHSVSRGRPVITCKGLDCQL